MRWSVSDTAEFGDYVSGPRIITPAVKEAMQQVLAEIKDGTFTKRLIEDDENGGKELREFRATGADHPIEKVGAQLRPMMAWIDDAGE
jgi:ketol-acid reductoisomerase